MTALRSLDQRRAASAYAYAGDPEASLDWAQKLPALLQVNGLLATWAFLLGKKEIPLLEALLGHLRAREDLQVNKEGGAADGFLHWVGGPTGAGEGIDGTLLRALTAEALAWSVWLKRAAEARGSASGSGGHA